MSVYDKVRIERYHNRMMRRIKMKINEINLDEEKQYNKIDEEKIKYDKKTRQLYWDIAIGLNDIDSLKPSQYFKGSVK